MKAKELPKYTNEPYDEYCKCGIYEISIVDKENTFYIGQASKTTGTKDFEKGFYSRWLKHLRDFEKNRHHNTHLQNITNKHSIDKIQFKIVEVINCDSSIDYFDEIETRYILAYNENSTVLNFSLDSKSRKGAKHSDETKRKISLGKKGKPPHINSLIAAKEANTGSIASEETRLKMSLARKGKNMPEETKQKISIGKKGQHYKNSRKISAINEDNTIIFNNAFEVVEYFNISYDYVRDLCRCNGVYKGLTFSYIGEYNRTTEYAKVRMLGYVNNELIYNFESMVETCITLGITKSMLTNHLKGSKLRKYPDLILKKETIIEQNKKEQLQGSI